MWHSVTGQVVSDTSKDHNASTIKVMLSRTICPEVEGIIILQNIRNYLPN